MATKTQSPTKKSGGGSNKAGGVFSVMRDEWVIMRVLLPYLSMLFGMFIILVLAFLTRLFITIDARWLSRSEDQRWLDTWVVTGLVILSGIILVPLAWTFWGQRKAVIIKQHAAITVGVSHVWWVLALWEDYGSWMFSRFTIVSHMFGCVVIGLSWCFRNWSNARAEDDSENGTGGFSDIGLGDGTHLRNRIIEGSMVTAEMAMGPGFTVDDAKRKRSQIAALAGKPLSQVHIREHPNGDMDKAEIVILKDNPFKDVRELQWSCEGENGLSIADPIEYGTYEDLKRALVMLGGKGHFLVMGMSGAGKSKAWQGIYGKVLRRTEVNLIFIDPIKGLQTAGPLLSGVDLFIDNLVAGQSFLGVLNERVIRARTDYLTSRGLDEWEPGCGINLLIVHIEEAGRFAKTKSLVEIAEAARSAGIILVVSLQRAQGSRLDTNTRYNLGSSMCFGTYGARDAEFALSEYTRQSGAIPHHWQNRYQGRHYLETDGVDPRRFALSIQADWLNMEELRYAIEEGRQWHSDMDDVTASAIGNIYSDYRHAVSVGDTQWQQLERGGLWTPTADTVEIPKVNPEDIIDPPTDTGGCGTRSTPMSTASAEEVLWNYLTEQASNGVTEMSFKDIVAGASPRCERKGPWINGRLKKWINAGNLPAQTSSGAYRMPVRKA